MKKSVPCLFAFLLIAATILAQDLTSDYQAAWKAFTKYKLSPETNVTELKNALAAIDRAVISPEAQADYKAWRLKGDIYNEIASYHSTNFTLLFGDIQDLPQVKNPALEAFKAYRESRSLAEKNYEIEDALNGIALSQSYLIDAGSKLYKEKVYEQIYLLLKAVIDAHEILIKENGRSSIVDLKDYHDLLLRTGYAALQADMIAEARPYLQQLYGLKYDDPLIYEAMYKIKAYDESPEAAYIYLKTGREKYPDDTSLLIAEINHAIRTNQFDMLIAKLETAILREPDNILLYTTAGNVYDQFYRKSTEAGDQAQAEVNFERAVGYFEKGLKLDNHNFDALYGLGSLFYNRASLITRQLVQPDGDSREDALKTEIMQLFQKALPYFQRSEIQNPNDINTLIALTEIYARDDNQELFNKFRERLEIVQGGGQVGESYFKHQ